MKQAVFIILCVLLGSGCTSQRHVSRDRHEFFIDCIKELPTTKQAVTYVDWNEAVKSCDQVSLAQVKGK